MATGLSGRKIVPDTSVLIDGRVSELVLSGELKGAHVIIAEASAAELEHLANSGRGIGWKGLRELAKLREHSEAGRIKLEFFGSRPTDVEVAAAPGGAIDNLIRSAALECGAELITSDRVQSEVARAKGVPVTYIVPDTEDAVRFEDLAIQRFFDKQTFSVHLKEGRSPHAKRGAIGQVRYEKVSDKETTRQELLDLASELLDFASRDDDSFIEIDRRDSRVVQVRDIRVAIAYPPFADGVEITAVRPVAKLKLEDYGLEAELIRRLEDHHRGVLISGRPGDGKSTFGQAVAAHLSKRGAVVKTMEQPRDMQVSGDITQYGALDGDMALTSEFLLLVRPDFVVYDEVRKTSDFETFADMRLAGVGLIGVTHANRAIDAVQRLIGRVELGIIPQVVDTVIHLVEGSVREVLELRSTVKVPEGMFQADLARPVIAVTDFRSGKEVFELYTYGDQVVVMPVGGGRRGDRPGGRGGRGAPHSTGVEENTTAASATTSREGLPARTKPQGKMLVIQADWSLRGEPVEVLLDGSPIFEGQVGPKGSLRLARRSPLGRQVEDGLRRGARVSLRRI
jgi:ATPase